MGHNIHSYGIPDTVAKIRKESLLGSLERPELPTGSACYYPPRSGSPPFATDVNLSSTVPRPNRLGKPSVAFEVAIPEEC